MAGVKVSPISDNFNVTETDSGAIIVMTGSGGGSFTNPMTQLYDLIIGGVAGAPVRLGVGALGTTLVVGAGGPAWSVPPGGGDFIGPGASVADNFVSFADNTGKVGKDSGVSASSFQASNLNLTSIAGLVYASTSFVKMTGANTFTLDTNTYLTSLTGLLLDQTTPQTVTNGAPIFDKGIRLTETITPTTPDATHAQLYVSDTNGKTNLNLITNDGLIQRLNRDLISTVRNTSAGIIPAGKVVYQTGSTGTAPNIDLAKADSALTMPAIGITMESIAVGAYGRIQRFGRTEFIINTSSWNEGDQLWIDAATAGDITNVKPSHPYLQQTIGNVVVKGVGTGSIFTAFTSYMNGNSSGTNNADFTIGATVAGSVKLAHVSTAQRTATFPNKDGVVAMTSDIPSLAGYEQQVNKDASGGYVGLTLLKINFKNVLGTFVSYFTNSNTASQTYTFQDKTGTVAMTTDINDASADTPLDADSFGFWDAVDAVLKKVTWATIKSTLKTYFDTLYVTLTGFPVDINRYGFINRTDTSISFDGTSVFTLTGVTWSYYRTGLKYTISGNKSVTVATPMVDGTMYYIYIDGTTGDLISGGAWTLNDTKVPVATIFWHNSMTPKFVLCDERHTVKVDRAWHREHHNVEGTKASALGTVSGLVAGSSTPADKTFGITGTKIFDEDLFFTLADITDPDGATPTYYNLYRTAATTYAWAISDMPFKYASLGGGTYDYIEYDLNGTSTPAGNNKFVNTYIFACSSVANTEANPEINTAGTRYFIMQGRGAYATAALAYAERFAASAGMPVIEGVALYQITWQTQAIGDTVKGRCQYVSIQTVNANITTTSTIPVGTHNSLAGLDGGTTNEYYHLTLAKYTVLNTATATPTASSVVVSDAGGKVDGWVTDATTTDKGKVELAIASEVNTGTDATRAITPDALAGSNLGSKAVGIAVFEWTTTVASGDGKAYFRIPSMLNGMNLVMCGAQVGTKSSSGNPTIMIARGRQANATSDFTFADMLSTALTIDANEYDSKDATTAYVIDTNNDDVATGDVIRIDVDGTGTGTKGLNVTVTFQLP